MSTKKLITMATVLTAVALATVGVAYGWWTDKLVINGTVQTGTFQVEFTNFWNSDTNCTYVMDPAKHTLTITADNAAPGFWCEASVEIKNTGSIPATIKTPVIVTTGPAYWQTYPYGTYPMTLAPGATAGGTQIEFKIPETETGNQGATSSLTVTFDAQQ